MLPSALSVRKFMLEFVSRYLSPETPEFTAVRAWLNNRLDHLDCQTTHLTHLDLHGENIMIDPITKRLIAVIDWDLSGFFLK